MSTDDHTREMNKWSCKLFLKNDVEFDNHQKKFFDKLT